MAITIKAPDGSSIQFPDGTPEATITDVMRKNFPAPAPAETSQALGFYQGLTHPLDNAAQWLEGAAKSVGIPTDAINSAIGLPSAQAATQQHQQYIASQEASGETPGGIGKFAGSVVGTLPAIIATKNPFVGGGIAGALDSDKNTIGGVATDAAIGAGLGKVSDLAIRGISSIVAPKVSSAVRTLVDEGVKLTPGQVLGGAAKRIEDAATSIPLVGDIIKTAQTRSLKDFNRAAINRTLAPIGEKLPNDIGAGHEAVAYAGQKLQDAYQAQLPKLVFKADPTYQANVANLVKLADNIPQYGSKPLTDFIATEITPRTSGSGYITGESFKEIDSKLGQEIAAYGKSPNPNDRKLADGFRELKNQLRRGLERANPAEAPKLKAIDRGYANLVRVENAASRLGARDGVFTPAQLQGAVRATDNSVRKRAVARGTAMMQDLASAGKEILPSSVADSGTATRGMLGYALGGGATHFLSPDAGAGILGAMAAYSKPGQRALTGLLARQPTSAEEKIADLISKLRTPSLLLGPAALANSRGNVGTP